MFAPNKSKIRDLFLKAIVDNHKDNENLSYNELRVFLDNGIRQSGRLVEFDGLGLHLEVLNRAEGDLNKKVPTVIFSEHISTITLEDNEVITDIHKAIVTDLETEERFDSNNILCSEILIPMATKANISKPIHERDMGHIYVGSICLVGNVVACDGQFIILHSERESTNAYNAHKSQMFHQLQLISMSEVSSISKGKVKSGRSQDFRGDFSRENRHSEPRIQAKRARY